MKPKSTAKAVKGSEDADDFDVDRASDPDESYGETVAKRKNPKRAKAAKKAYIDLGSEDDAGPVTPQQQVKVEGNSSRGKKRKAEDSSSEPDVHGKTHDSSGQAQYESVDEDDEAGEQYVAVGSRFLDFNQPTAGRDKKQSAKQVKKEAKAGEITSSYWCSESF